ncbi:FG-GAP-like repeat-containing protein [Flavihumibacter sp. UBA7668]|uniref:FG-GAP-like repeat-containing protein n=1 Tax=Flavihumibacter sp. UBA7668 TaxID=1946542 RepID=UPI0025C50B2A|nr:FG-GAP-like repeat-containing protein [Flavihumibacter sp. UBA7668]
MFKMHRFYLLILLSFSFIAVVQAQDSLNLSERVPVVTGISPLSGPIGTIVTIYGKNFSTTPAENLVRMGGILCPVLSATSTELSIRIPVGMNSQRLSVTSKDGLITITDYLFRVRFESLGKTLGKRSLRLARSYIDDIVTPFSTSTTDLNNDGKLEFLVTDQIKNSKIFQVENEGNFKFSSGTKFGGFYGFLSTAQDLNGDGELEIIYSSTYVLEIYQKITGVSDSSYTSVLQLRHDSSNQLLKEHSIVDINRDGRLDIIEITESGFLVYPNLSKSGSINFGEPVLFSNPQTDLPILACDFDGDNIKELILVEKNSPKSVQIIRNLHNVGDPISSDKLRTEFKLEGPKSHNFLKAAEDIDGDGKQDIYLISPSEMTMYIYKNISSLSELKFSNKTIINVSENSLESSFADLDGDGIRDLINICFDSQNNNSETGGRTLFIQKNISSADNISFDPPVEFSFMGNASALSLADGDLNQDGLPDLIVGLGYYNGSVILLQNGTNSAKVELSPDSPPAGYIDQSMFLDDSIRTHNNAPFVRRHYEINPEQNGSTAKATVTLYFKQEDFTEFNAYKPDDLNLPTGPNDAIGKANLRVYKYGGHSVGSNHPADYADAGIEINPDDNKIVWNTAEELWEVSFDVTGFSGFFLAPQNDGMIAKPPAPAVPVIVTEPAQEACSGTSIRLVASSAGCSDCIYSWNTSPVTVDSGLTVTSSGTYTVSATNKGGTVTASVAIQVFQTPAKPVITVQGNLLTSSAVSGNQWFFNGQAITGATQQKLTVFESGTYSVQVKSGACISELSEEKQVVVTSIDPLELQGGIRIHPNPLRSDLYINNPQLLQLSITVFDLSGKKITAIRTNKSSTAIDLQQVRPGIYLLQLFDERNDRFFIRKIIKE